MYFAVIPFPHVDAVLFHLGPLEVRWYALAYVGGLLFATWYMSVSFQRHRYGVPLVHR